MLFNSGVMYLLHVICGSLDDVSFPRGGTRSLIVKEIQSNTCNEENAWILLTTQGNKVLISPYKMLLNSILCL